MTILNVCVNITAKPVYVMLFGTTHVRPVAAGGQFESLPINIVSF